MRVLLLLLRGVWLFGRFLRRRMKRTCHGLGRNQSRGQRKSLKPAPTAQPPSGPRGRLGARLSASEALDCSRVHCLL